MRTLAFWIPFILLGCAHQIFQAWQELTVVSSSRFEEDLAQYTPEELVRNLRNGPQNLRTPALTTDDRHADSSSSDHEAANDVSDDTSSSSDEEAAYWMEGGCFYYENLCHSSYHWFYQHNGNSSPNKSGKWQEPFQMNLHSTPLYRNKTVLLPNYPLYVNVTASHDADTTNAQECYTSPISHHIIYNTPYNNMIGEFWLNAMTGLLPLLHPSDKSSSAPFLPTPEHLQTYLLMDEKSNIYDGHQLFSSALPTTHPVLPFTALLDQTNCQCLPKVVMCGFVDKVEWRKKRRAAIRAKKSDNGKTGSLDKQKEAPVATKAAPGPKQLMPFGGSIYWPAVRHGRVKPPAANGGPTHVKQSLVHLQRHVRQHLFGNHSLIPQMVQDYRHGLLQKYALGFDPEKENDDDWKIIGLANRANRRVWKNIDMSLKQCNRGYKEFKIICVEINMDDKATSTTIHQAVVHHAVNAIIGIHGSHLTNAVLLRPGSYMLELRPWLPDFESIGRGYFRKTNGATPIGLMFTNTDINHVGLALERSSCDSLCPDTYKVLSDSNYRSKKATAMDNACLWDLYNNNKTRESLSWDNRDFIVDPSILDKFVGRFMTTREPITSCRDFQNRAQRKPRLNLSGKEQDFTLFNVQCRDVEDESDDEGQVSGHQFFNNYTGTSEEVEEAEELARQMEAASTVAEQQQQSAKARTLNSTERV